MYFSEFETCEKRCPRFNSQHRTLRIFREANTDIYFHRYGEQYVRAVRGELRQLPRQAGQMHQLRASPGYVREQVLRSVSPVHVRDARLQLRAVSFYLRDLQRHRGEPMHLLSTRIVFSERYVAVAWDVLILKNDTRAQPITQIPISLGNSSSVLVRGSVFRINHSLLNFVGPFGFIGYSVRKRDQKKMKKSHHAGIYCHPPLDSLGERQTRCSESKECFDYSG